MVKEKENSEKEQERFQLVEVPTQTDFVIRDVEADQDMTTAQALVLVLNEVSRIGKAL